jgi:hypothetical protein
VVDIPYKVRIAADNQLGPIGCHIMDTYFVEQMAWASERWEKNIDFVACPDQDNQFVYSIWGFDDPQKAMLFKLTWGGR